MLFFTAQELQNCTNIIFDIRKLNTQIEKYSRFNHGNFLIVLGFSIWTHVSVRSGLGSNSRKDELFEVLVSITSAADGRTVRSRWFNFSHKQCPEYYIHIWHIQLSNFVSQLHYHFPCLAPSPSITFGDAYKGGRERKRSKRWEGRSTLEKGTPLIS